MVYHYLTEPDFKTEIDINALFDVLDQINITYKKSRGIKKYINGWKKVFYDVYISERDNVFKFGCQEHYYRSVYIAGSEYRIHFKIDPTRELRNESYVHNISLSAFSDKDNGYSNILYNHCRLDLSLPIYRDPIIIVPLNLIGFSYLVIDGNHRVTRLKFENEESINCVLLSALEASELIQSNFEKALYLFLCESGIIEEAVKNSVTKYYSNGSFRFPE